MKIKSIILICFISISIVLCSCEESNNSSVSHGIIPKDTVETAEVLFVYDGDTYQCLIDGNSYKVRLFSVDCFEVSEGDRLISQANSAGISIDSALSLGYEAAYFADSVLTGKEVILTRKTNEPNRDVYDRLLRHIIVEGKKFDSLLKANNLTVY